ncbi:alpha/beta hydrolase family esterase [Caldimonas brevitalea]|uniref:Uncharacterized protein n=1 Tax=Caldimonas brevitalea TaxID=413882 RepID=A0A0G3BNQ1_9BURK|nr:PHB depolymerase family esterase [Caldimonas brevitalea]AKJ29618.1 hypothetical protein AAW51_2927 [Caldimonas brevitalea]
MKPNWQDLMRQATLAQAASLFDAAAVMQRSFSSTASARPAPPSAPPPLEEVVASPQPLVLDVEARVIEPAPSLRARRTRTRPAHVPVRRGPGEFRSGHYTQVSGSREYRLYIPPGAAEAPLPLVVMLHGCVQDPDDFAAGTRMNEVAREHGFYVLYPAQTKNANQSRCWNWFKHNHQQRGRGEPALLAAMTAETMNRYRIDRRRVYIAGLSAGGSMAAIVAHAYPELYAAVGVHSGLPPGSAFDIASGLAAMREGPRPAWHPVLPPTGFMPPSTAVPTIVFHGDRDPMVHPRNADGIIASALGKGGARPGARLEQSGTVGGRRYTRFCYLEADRQHVFAEQWVVHGAGHAWAGGHPHASCTEAHGPDASREMWRFFAEHPRP